MANARGKEVDTTSLSLDHAEQRGFLHRDYLGHCLRWSHVVKFMLQNRRYQTAHLLDVGCGKEMPLPKMMYSSRMTHKGGSYTGVDYGKLEWPSSIPENVGKKFDMCFAEKFDFAKDELPRASYDVVVCFEVLEHVEPMHAFRMLQRFREVVAKNGTIFISTPCYDKHTGAADNHVNEMTHDALFCLIGLAGLNVNRHWGVFASQKDYKHLLKNIGDKSFNPRYPTPELFNALGEYYDSNVLACLFAPLYPEHARNCMWQLTAGKIMQPPAHVKLLDPDHSNSKRWVDDVKKILKEVK